MELVGLILGIAYAYALFASRAVKLATCNYNNLRAAYMEVLQEASNEQTRCLP